MSSSSTTTISSSATASCTAGHLLNLFNQYLLNSCSIITQIYSIMYGRIVNFRIDIFNFRNRFHDIKWVRWFGKWLLACFSTNSTRLVNIIKNNFSYYIFEHRFECKIFLWEIELKTSCRAGEPSILVSIKIEFWTSPKIHAKARKCDIIWIYCSMVNFELL